MLHSFKPVFIGDYGRKGLACILYFVIVAWGSYQTNIAARLTSPSPLSITENAYGIELFL